MRSMLKGRPSPAMIVAIVALVTALGGTAFAGVATISKISGKTVKKNTLPGNRVKKNTLPGNRVKRNTITGQQVKESSLGQVPNAANATNATNATTANGPVAWAHVNSAGAVLNGRNVSSANVSIGAANFYCFTGLTFPFSLLQVTVDYWNGTLTLSNTAQASIVGVGNASTGGTGCPANTQVFVRGQNPNAGAGSATAFFISFYS